MLLKARNRLLKSNTAFHPRSRLHVIFSLAGVLLLSGCLIPEKFSAKVDVQSDAGYTFHYSGTAINPLIVSHIKSKGATSDKDEAGFKAEAEKMGKLPEVQKAVYKGAGRYQLEIESQKKAGQSLAMFDAFQIRTDKDGVLVISSAEIGDKEKHDMEQLGISIDGTFEVHLPKNAEVVASNATSTPTFGFGTYSWRIGRIDQRPMLKVKIK
jgi:hypothetical protein